MQSTTTADPIRFIEKTCSRCSETKLISEFGRNKRKRDGIQVYCKSCMKEFRAEKQYDAKRWLTNREEEAARAKKYHAANSARIAARKKATGPAYRARAADSIRARNMTRKCDQRTAVPGWADQQAITLVYKKAAEFGAILGLDMQVDHIVPLRSKIVCGLHCVENLQLLAADLNYRKKNFVWPDMPD